MGTRDTEQKQTENATEVTTEKTTASDKTWAGESTQEVRYGSRPLPCVRRFRSYIYWEAVKKGPLQERKQQGWAQRTQGTKPAWEDWEDMIVK